MTSTKIIAFFSSDAKPLYKSDVFNSLCLPDGYTVQFRYNKVYIHQDIHKDLLRLKGKRGCIFFAISQDHDLGELQYSTKNISIREVSIIDFIIDHDTDTIHFYLKLGKYCDFVIQSNGNLPPSSFVSYVEVIRREKNRWSDRVNAIKDEFPAQLFLKIKILDKKSNYEVQPIYIQSEKQSIYELKDEKEYLFEISFIHSDDILRGSRDITTVLKIDERSNQIQISSKEIIDIGATIDTRRLRFVTKATTSNILDSYILFEIIQYEHATRKLLSTLQSFSIIARITKQYYSILLFSWYSSLGVGALVCIAVFTNTIKAGRPNYFILCLGFLLSAVSSALLFKKFNKTIK